MRENFSENKVAQKILDIAQGLLQERGYNSFSYRDLSQQVGIRTSSIHYYFPTKEDLARTLTVRYREHFKSSISQIDAQTDDLSMKLHLYLKLFLDSFKSCKKICLCSMLAADFANMPLTVQDEIKGLFADNERWLADILEKGRNANVFKFEGDPMDNAKTIFAALEGATISARTFGDESRLSCLIQWLESTLKVRN